MKRNTCLLLFEETLGVRYCEFWEGGIGSTMYNGSIIGAFGGTILIWDSSHLHAHPGCLAPLLASMEISYLPWYQIEDFNCIFSREDKKVMIFYDSYSVKYQGTLISPRRFFLSKDCLVGKIRTSVYPQRLHLVTPVLNVTTCHTLNVTWMSKKTQKKINKEIKDFL